MKEQGSMNDRKGKEAGQKRASYNCVVAANQDGGGGYFTKPCNQS